MARTRQPKSIDAFTNPFDRNHCVVLAYTTVSGAWEPGAAIALAELGRRAGLLDSKGSADRWQDANGRGIGVFPSRASEHDASLTAHIWADLVGCRVAEVIHFPPEYRWDDRRHRRVSLRPKVREFARHQGRSGRWVVYTRSHARAIIDGKAYFYIRPGARVQMAVRLEEKEGK